MRWVLACRPPRDSMRAMTAAPIHDIREPLCLFTASRPTPEAFGDARCLRFEYSSRGDRIPGRLLLPARDRGPFPLVLLQHGKLI